MDQKYTTISQIEITLKNNIFYFTPQPGSHTNLKTIQEIHLYIQNLCNGKKYPAIFNLAHLKSIDLESRKYIAEKTGDVISAVALITPSPISQVIGNFFIGINKPFYPARLFNNEHDAIIWLQETTRSQ